MRLGLVALAAALLLTGCGLVRRPAPNTPSPRYVVGAAYKADGTWFYPREQFQLDTTGLAVVLPDRRGPTADGEAYDGAAMAGAHPTVQLPAVARVTNFETGLQALIRINDRGPANPARLMGLTRHAADRLGIAPGTVARVRMQIEDGPSQALRDQLLGGAPGVSAAPRSAVMAEALPPPRGIAPSSRGRVLAGAQPATAAVAFVGPEALPDNATRVFADPGQLWLRAGEFGLARYAQQVQSKLPGMGAFVERVRQGRTDVFRVRAGPFATVAQADSALDQAMRAGVTDARIAVE